MNIGYVTLHVGLGTFRPVKEDDIEQHDMHSEYCVIPPETATLINETKGTRRTRDLRRYNVVPHARELGTRRTDTWSRQQAGRASTSTRATASR